MSEKVRAFNLTAGNMLTTSASSAGGVTLIGAPTLISSTFTGVATQSLTPTAGGNSPTPPPPALLNLSQQHSGGSDTESSSEFAPGAIMAQLNFHLLHDLSVAGGGLGGGGGAMSESNSIMNSSQISAISNDSIALSASPGVGGAGAGTSFKANNGKHLNAQSVAGKSCRFPKLEECAHFHYERVQLGPLAVRLVDDKSELLTSSIASQSIGGDIANGQSSTVIVSGGGAGPSSCRSFSPSSCWFIIKVMPHRTDPFLIRRSFDNIKMLDEMLHRCVYDRKISGLRNLNDLDFKGEEDVEYAVAKYLERFSKIASDSLTCGTILTWFQLDNKGRRLPLADGDTMRSINTPAVGAAYGVRRYTAQASDEISIEVGDMISVIDMPSPAESIWWRGKKSHLQKSHYEVGFFPQSCVATIGDKVPRYFPMPAPLVGQLDVSPTKPVLRKHGKLIAFFRSFILSRPSRRRLKQSGIYRERVFSCDLSEHLLNSGQEIPMVLKCCAEFLEDYGIVDGIYRLSGITSNIQRLRRAFDEERIPDLGNPEMKQDIHAVSSLLKMYFRELPNPLCTYQLYDNFVEAIQEKSESNERLRLMKETVLKLPPPHYRTLKYLASHLNSISQHSARTGMTDKNLAIVWAPNLLRSPALESGGVAALRGVGVQAVVTEYLIRNCHLIFDALDESTSNARLSYIATAGATPAGGAGESRMDSLTDCESLLVEQREHDQSLTFAVERPKSLSASGPKLISLEEAQERHSRLDGYDMNKSMPINVTNNTTANIGSYIEVGGGPSSLPDKYHTVLPVPRSWQKRKTHSWKSLFSRNQRTSSGNGGGNSDLKSSLSPSGADDPLPPHHKEATQVTFAEADSIITHGSGSKSMKSLLKHQEKTKSIELYDSSRADSSRADSISKPMEICVRSSSIDSLRTAGHSRSVSHDSYFDLLQSPQRGHLATTCPSRELSELGLNFDREEPEMRIFSESESLVSSPRVGKENIPPSSVSAATSRRILRARPEEFSTSQTNSVNPSPKKQPRLNLLLSPNSGGVSQNWSQAQAAVGECDEHLPHTVSSDESCCKRYKLEDQLSDIQFIDCSTPEHTIAANSPSQTQIYACVQIHNPPKQSLYNSPASESAAKTLPDNELPTPTPIAAQDPSAACSKGHNSDVVFTKGALDSINTRYSYPTVQLGSKRKEQESKTKSKERFSYPGLSRMLPSKEESYGRSKLLSRPDSMEHTSTTRNVSFSQQQPHQSSQSSHLQHLPKPVPELLRPKNRYSYCDTSENISSIYQRHSAVTQQQLNLLLMRSTSSELAKPLAKVKQQHNELLERMRTTEVTPSSPPTQSPRYSLLVGGDTSSENSSAVNTPQYDLEPLIQSSKISGMSGNSPHSIGSSSHRDQLQNLLTESGNSICAENSRESLGLSNSINSPEQRDMHALKRELSLDLKTSNCVANDNAKMNVDYAERTSTLSAKLHHQLQHQLVASPNNSNFTDNTSQSVTPSEYGYQQLQLQSSLHSSLLETAENSPNYEDYENTPSNMNSPVSSEGGEMTAKLLTGAQSPIKSTISITYNLKSPKDECDNKPLPALREKPRRTPKQQPLLETSFDEHTVYEQVKIFRNSVTEVNQLLKDGCRKSGSCETQKLIEDVELSNLAATHKKDHFSAEKGNKILALSGENQDDEQGLLNPTEDVDMQQQSEDSFEVFSDQLSSGDERLLYQNVELRKPKSFYENISGESMKAPPDTSAVSEDDANSEKLELELDSLDSIRSCDDESSKSELMTARRSNELSLARKSPSNFSVKQLANKFESSPIEQLQAFDFSVRGSVKKHPAAVVPENVMRTSPTNSVSNATVSVPLNTNTPKQKLNKTQQITRSLDENAFVREFGAKQLDLATKSTQQLPEYASHEPTLTQVANRRKSYDFTRPKTLNQPKRLPGMPITEEICMKSSTEKSLAPALKLDLQREQNYNNSLEHECESVVLKITPTTENRISLIQNNVGAALPPLTDQHLSNSNSNLSSLNSLKVLSGVKLDRERIDKIKEERRQQLTQKYRAESFKSRSKTDLNSPQKEEDVRFHTESLRVKSKSRGDMRTLQKDVDNLKEFGRSGVGTMLGSETTLHQKQRVRSISDEKNQNCEVATNNSTTAAASKQTKTNCNASNSSASNTTTTNSSDSSSSDDYSKRRSTQQRATPDEYSARATVQKFERKSLDYANSGNAVGVGVVRDRRGGEVCSGNSLLSASRSSLSSTREKISPQFSIRDVTAMFESRSQNQQ